jgi:predicted nucleic acid-binding protein
LSSKHSENQFWDTSALVSLILEERHSVEAVKAQSAAKRYFAWEWIQVESHAALIRRGARPEQFKALRTILDHFRYVGLGSDDQPAVIKVLEKHKLRAADAGHLFCLKQLKRVIPDIAFVCFDQELSTAADKEGILNF